MYIISKFKTNLVFFAGVKGFPSQLKKSSSSIILHEYRKLVDMSWMSIVWFGSYVPVGNQKTKAPKAFKNILIIALLRNVLFSHDISVLTNK